MPRSRFELPNLTAIQCQSIGVIESVGHVTCLFLYRATVVILNPKQPTTISVILEANLDVCAGLYISEITRSSVSWKLNGNALHREVGVITEDQSSSSVDLSHDNQRSEDRKQQRNCCGNGFERSHLLANSAIERQVVFVEQMQQVV